jgi:superfamily II DNA or RNA helicase
VTTLPFTAPAPAALPKLELRPYQQEAIAAVIDACKAQSPAHPLLEMATGCGKTVIFCQIAKERRPRALILVHRDELVRQAVATLEWVWPEVLVGVVQADDDEYDADVVVASVQSLHSRRLHRWAPMEFKTIVVDEAHHSRAPTYERILDYLKAPCVLGVTATPYRGDRLALSTRFDGVTYSYAAPQAISDGWLCDVKGYRIGTDVILDENVPTRGGDFEVGALAAAIDNPQRNAVAVGAVRKYAMDRKVLAFTATVAHAEHLTATFQAAGIPADWVDGTMPRDHRRAKLKAFAQGEIKVLSNCAVLTEGYDETALDCILLARPTKSLGLWTQMVGRGLRTHPGKENLILLDLADTTRRHKLIGIHTLVGRDRPLRDGTTLTQAISGELELKEPWIVLAERLQHKTEEVEQLWITGATRAAKAGERPDDSWQEMLDEMLALRIFDESNSGISFPVTEPQLKVLTGFGWPAEAARQLTKQEASKVLDRMARVHKAWVTERVPMLAMVTGWDQGAVSDVLVDGKGLWKLHQATEGQVNLLRRRGIPAVPGLTKGEAKMLIDKLMGATEPQDLIPQTQ